MASKKASGGKNKLSNIMSTGPVEAAPRAYKMSREDKMREARYRAEDDLRTLQRAKEIQCDRSRMGMCKTVANEQIKALKGVAGKTNRR